MRDRCRSAAAAFVLAGWGSIAEPASAVETVSFEEAIERAVQNHEDVLRAQKAILQAEALLRKARAAILPSLDAAVTRILLDEERGFDSVVVQPREQTSIAATLSVPILAASRWARRTQAADQVAVARLRAAEARRQIGIAAAQAYLAVIAAGRQVEVDERARDTARVQYEYARTRLEAGAGSRLDTLRSAEFLSTAESQLERSRLALALAQEGLGVLLGAEGPVGASEEPALEAPPEASEEAVAQRADLQLRAAEKAAAQRVARDSWKDRLPEIVASLEPLHLDPPGAFQDADTWRATIAARIPLDVGRELAAERLFRTAAAESAALEAARTEREARAQVRSARAAVEAAERRLAFAREAARAAAEALQITETAYRAGARTNLELVDAQRRSRDADTGVAQAEDALRQAKLDLRIALGLFSP